MGWFRVTREVLVSDPRHAREIFRDLIIHDMHRHFDYGQSTMYLAEGDQFDEVPEGEEAPRYELEISEAGAVTFQRVGQYQAVGTADPHRRGDSVL